MALNTTYVKNEQGATFIAASQRPDGTWRKPRRVREGYVPQEEVPLYESKGKQFVKSKPLYPPGVTPEMVAESKAKREKAEKALSQNVHSPIPGLVIDTPETKSGKKKKKKKSVGSSSVDCLAEAVAKAQISQPEAKPVAKQSKTAETKAAKSKTAKEGSSSSTQNNNNNNNQVNPSQGVGTDPAKRVKNLRKKLREIELIEQKIASGELKSPEKEQLDKVARKKEVLDEIDGLLPLISEA